jgi:hypothetical protein
MKFNFIFRVWSFKSKITKKISNIEETSLRIIAKIIKHQHQKKEDIRKEQQVIRMEI